MRASALIGALLLACACGGGEEPPVGDGELVLGSAALDGTGFVDVTDGTDVELVPGAQGGFHVWLNMRIHNTEGRLFVSRFARRVEDDALILRSEGTLLEVPGEAMEDWWQPEYAAPAFMCPSPIGLAVFDREIYYDVILRDEDDNEVARDTLILTPRCPAGDQYDFCLEICSG